MVMISGVKLLDTCTPYKELLLLTKSLSHTIAATERERALCKANKRMIN